MTEFSRTSVAVAAYTGAEWGRSLLRPYRLVENLLCEVCRWEMCLFSSAAQDYVGNRTGVSTLPFPINKHTHTYSYGILSEH